MNLSSISLFSNTPPPAVHPANATETPSTAPTGTSTSANPADSLTSENTFLKLLVAQIQNQDPTSPTDPVQFVGQLTQYSELEQLMQINSGLQGIEGGSGSATASGATTPANSSVTTGTGNTQNNPGNQATT